ncbi:myosin-IIIb-like isoform X2 [Stylophora pistillata]|uniref:myosin-IIIb-like isoform X2 n=1 Tax=Stylophora pistillata TaxID=50429 RepID=UPI000C057290|nr:myosin-IIIb-like isoform X2 [Stylophora pistillata]
MVGFSFAREEQLYAMMGKSTDSLKELGPPTEWELVERIGEGTYGEVFNARNKISGEIAAAKVIDSIHEKIEEVLPELEILSKYSTHPNIAGFHGAFMNVDTKRHDQLWLVMELCRGGSVTNLVKSLRKKGKYLEEDLIAYILFETLKGIEHLHRHNVMHRDIKGPNVMLTNRAEIRLIDFGVSAELSNILMRRNSSVGTPFWMAPEVIACEQQLDYSYDVRCDIWSLGITAIELADGTTPLSDQHPMRALFKIPRSKSPSMKNPERWSHEYRDFIAKCLVKDFEPRAHASDMLSHVFVRWVADKRDALRRKLMSLMDGQYQGKDGIMVEATKERDQEALPSPLAALKKKNLQRSKHMQQVDNLAELGSLTEDIILSHLLERYLNNQIYTYIGDILIAVNPLQTLNLYGPELAKKYRNSQKSALPPHIFMVADMTHQAMIHNKNPQCCLISGESGAGKTVSADYLVRHLAELGKAGNRSLEAKILQVNPLMEALGNAQTVINENSSRFGKYLELHFTANGALTGGMLSEYLLEKSRVVSQSRGERNFHIFYYMIAGLAYNKKLEKYSFKLYSQHNYLQTGGRNLQDLVCTLGNRRKFEEVQRCFDIIGFSHEEVSQLFSVLAAIIHLGDIHFTEDESVSHLSDKSMVSNPQVLLIVSSLLGINAVELRDALTTNSNVTRGETIVRNNSVDQAVDYRDGMAKALYGKLFSWLVHRINALLRTERGRLVENDYRIGILDIFGFENFKRNSFEQLCINIANEQVQFYFNQQIFSWELEEYRSEGISLERISFTDNRPVLDMFLQKPIGLLALLDEESRFPKATDFTLVEKFNKKIDCAYYEQPKENDVFPSFVIAHYAGRVKYDATNFLEKNRDTLSPDIIHVLRSSDNRLVRTLMQHPLARSGVSVKKNSSQPPTFQVEKDKKPNGLLSLPETKLSPLLESNTTSRWQQTVSVHFRYSLRDLLAKLLPSESHFVRCIRPNEQMIAGRFDQEKVQSQLRYTGVLETTRIRRQGYSERITFAEFVKRYRVIAYPLHKSAPYDAAACSEILRKSKLQNWLIGRTKVFLKYYHVEELAKLLEIHRRKVVTIQRVARGWLVRRRYESVRRRRHQAATVIQKYSRGYLARKHHQREVNKKHFAACVIQRAYRRLVQRRRFSWWLKWYHVQQRRKVKSAIKIQAVVRGYLARKCYLRLRRLRIESAIKIQAVYRGRLLRKNYANIRRKQKVLKFRHMAKVRAVVRIQSAFRGYRARKYVSELKSKAEKRETNMIYFFQQVEDSSDTFFRAQKGHKRANVKMDRVVIKEGKHQDPAEFWSSPNADKEAVASQQETQTIFFIHQANMSWATLLDHTRKHQTSAPRSAQSQVRTPMRKHDHAPVRDSPRVPQGRSFEIRPKEVMLAEMHNRESPRNSRNYRKEIWSAGDETYFRQFADERLKKDFKDQGRRIRDMLSIVERSPSDTDERKEKPVKETIKPTPRVARAKNFFENQDKPPEPKPIVRRTKSNEWKPKPAPQESAKRPVPPPAEKLAYVKPKPKEPQNQADLVKIAVAQQAGPVKPDLRIRPRSISAPPQELPYIPPPDYKLPREKLGYLRHVTPGPTQVLPENFQVEDVNLRHIYRSGSSTPTQTPRYSHLLRKTGKRGELGIADDDDNSDVTRISFNVPLIGVT